MINQIIQHWFRLWLGAEQAVCHYPNQWLLKFYHAIRCHCKNSMYLLNNHVKNKINFIEHHFDNVLNRNDYCIGRLRRTLTKCIDQFGNGIHKVNMHKLQVITRCNVAEWSSARPPLRFQVHAGTTQHKLSWATCLVWETHNDTYDCALVPLT